MTTYLQRMERNIKLAYFKNIFFSLLFFAPIWFAFETQYTSAASLGIIYAASHFLTVVLELPTGAFADLIGRRNTFLLGLVINAVSYVVMGMTQNVWWLWAGYLQYAVAVSLISGAEDALHYDSLKELGREDQYSKFNATKGFIFRVGLFVSTILGGYIFDINMRMPYLLVGLFTMVGAAFTLLDTEPKIDSEKFTFKNYLKQTKDGAKQLVKSTYIKDFSIYYMFTAGITWYYVYFLSNAFATQIGFTAQERGVVLGLIFLFMAITNMWVVNQKWLTKRVAYKMFPILMMIGFIPGIWLTNKWLAIPFMFLLNLSSTMRWSILDMYANKEFESKYRATAISTLNMAVSIVAVILFIVGGKVVDLYGASFMATMLGILTAITVVPMTRVLVKNHSEN